MRTRRRRRRGRRDEEKEVDVVFRNDFRIWGNLFLDLVRFSGFGEVTWS